MRGHNQKVVNVNMTEKRNKLYTDFVGRDILDGISADNFDSLKNVENINMYDLCFFLTSKMFLFSVFTSLNM